MNTAQSMRALAARLLKAARGTSSHAKKMALLRDGLLLAQRAEQMKDSGAPGASKGSARPKRATTICCE